jgi:hypothetical protein
MSVRVTLGNKQVERLEVHILSLNPDGLAHVVIEHHLKFSIKQKHVAVQLVPTYDFEKFQEELQNFLDYGSNPKEMDVLETAFRDFTRYHRDNFISVTFL